MDKCTSPPSFLPANDHANVYACYVSGLSLPRSSLDRSLLRTDESTWTASRAASDFLPGKISRSQAQAATPSPGGTIAARFMVRVLWLQCKMMRSCLPHLSATPKSCPEIVQPFCCCFGVGIRYGWVGFVTCRKGVDLGHTRCHFGVFLFLGCKLHKFSLQQFSSCRGQFSPTMYNVRNFTWYG